MDDRIVILVHGIRTFGSWQNRLAEMLEQEVPGAHVHIYKYGYFSTLAFVLPLVRNLVVRRLRTFLESLAEESREARLDVVAHSFGTVVVAQALRGTHPSSRPRIPRSRGSRCSRPRSGHIARRASGRSRRCRCRGRRRSARHQPHSSRPWGTRRS